MHPTQPSTLQPPSVVSHPPSQSPSSTSNTLSHALALPTRPPEVSQQQEQPHEQQQFIQPHAIYHNPPSYAYAGSTSAQPPLPPTQPPTSDVPPPPATTDSPSVVPLKRKPGRPRGSKTKNRKISGVAGPSAPHSHLHDAQREREEDDDYEVVDLESPVAPAFPPVQLTSAASDGTYSGLGVGFPSRRLHHHPPSPESSTAPAPEPTAETGASSTATINSFYEFQWRVMQLCTVFYESAGELVRATDPAVLAQSFSLGSQKDPMVLLQNAKDYCDAFLADTQSLSRGPIPPPVPATMFPAQAVPVTYVPPQEPVPVPGPSQPPPQLYYPTPVSPTAASSHLPYQTPSASYVHTTPAPTPSSPVYPQSFQVPRPSTASSLSGAIPPPPPQPTVVQTVLPPPNTPYGGSIASGSTVQAPTPRSAALTSVTSAPKGIIQSTHGAWSDEETGRLKQLAEQSRSRNSNGEIDWDWTVENFGETRSRHQILIKATNMGLKATSTHPSRLKKRTSMHNTHEAIASGSAPLPPTASAQGHPVETIQEHLVVEENAASGSHSSLGSHASPHINPPPPPIPQHPSHISTAGLQGSGMMSPSASVTSTPTMPTDQSHQQGHLPPHVPHPRRPSHHRRPSSSTASSGPFQSPAMGPSASATPAVWPRTNVEPSPTFGHQQIQPQHPQGGFIPPPQYPSRSASYSYGHQPAPPPGQGTPRQMQAPRIPMSPQFQHQQQRSVSHAGPSTAVNPAVLPQYPTPGWPYDGRPVPQSPVEHHQGLTGPPPGSQQQQQMPPPAPIQRAVSYPHHPQSASGQFSPTAEFSQPPPQFRGMHPSQSPQQQHQQQQQQQQQQSQQPHQPPPQPPGRPYP